MAKLEIKSYSPDDYEVFKKYITQAFHEKYILGEQKYIDWQYGGNLYIAKIGDKVIGHFGCRDIPYKIYNETKPARMLMNLFVLPPYRMSGAAAHLAGEVFKTSKPALVSDTRPVAHKLFSHIRPGWRELGNMSRFISVLNPTHDILKNYRIPPTSLSSQKEKNFKVEEVSIIEDTLISDFWPRARSRYPVTVERTPEYLSWRFWSHPFFNYRVLTAKQNGALAGFLIWRAEEDQGFKIARIIDFISVREAENSLVAGFLSVAKAKNADAADFFFSGNFYANPLADGGFFNVTGTDFEKFPILFNPILSRRSSINLECDFETSLTDCYFTKADGDQDRPNPH